MEKRIIIGRGTDCDVIIPDETDNVSRHHLVITFGFMGKMKISDTSTNGTFINENRMLKGSSVPVTRDDKIRMGAACMLDWDAVKDPFVVTRRVAATLVVLLVTLSIAVGVYVWTHDEEDNPNPVVLHDDIDKSNNDEWNADSTNARVPTESRINVGKDMRKQAAKTDKGTKRKTKTPYKSKKSSRKSQAEKAMPNENGHKRMDFDEDMKMKEQHDFSREKM